MYFLQNPGLKSSCVELSCMRNLYKKKLNVLTFNAFRMESIHFPKMIYACQGPEICEFREMKLIYECRDHHLAKQMYFFLQGGLRGSLYTVLKMRRLLAKCGGDPVDISPRKSLLKASSLSYIHIS